MKYCGNCGSVLSKLIPEGDEKIRDVCSACGSVFYDSWQVLVQVIVFSENKLLLMKRATEPYKGCWTFPGGFVESHENLKVAACRELLEETGVSVEPENLEFLATISVEKMNQIQILFRTRTEEVAPKQSCEAEQVQWFLQQDVPEKELRIPSIYPELLRLFEANRSGRFSVYFTTATETEVSWDSFPLLP